MKKIMTVVLLVEMALLALVGCGGEKLYLPQTIQLSNDGEIVCTYEYSYDIDNRLVTEFCRYEGIEALGYSDYYEYDTNGLLVSLRRIEAGGETTYTAEHITDYKYQLLDENGTLFRTIILDYKGHIISVSTPEGQLDEYVYVYDKQGRPETITRQIVHPSGSSKILTYQVVFDSRDTYHYSSDEQPNLRYTVRCLVVD